MYSKSLLFTSISYVQERFKLNKRNQSWIKLFFCIGGSFDLQYYLILVGTNNVLHSSVEKYFVHSVGTGISENLSFNRICHLTEVLKIC